MVLSFLADDPPFGVSPVDSNFDSPSPSALLAAEPPLSDAPPTFLAVLTRTEPYYYYNLCIATRPPSPSLSPAEARSRSPAPTPSQGYRSDEAAPLVRRLPHPLRPYRTPTFASSLFLVLPYIHSQQKRRPLNLRFARGSDTPCYAASAGMREAVPSGRVRLGYRRAPRRVLERATRSESASHGWPAACLASTYSPC